MEGMSFHVYDILMLIVLLGTTIFGFWKGMAWQLASLASVVVSAVVALRFRGDLAPMFSASEPWNRFLAMLVLYLGTSLAIWLLFRLVAGFLDRVRLKEFDRQLGAMFGLFKGVLLCVVITFFAVTLSETARQKVLGSNSGRYIAVLIKNATPILPDDVTRVLGEYLDQLDRKLDPTTPPDRAPLEGLKTDEASQGLAALGEELGDDLKQTLDQNAQRARDQVRDELRGQMDQWRDEVDRRIEAIPTGGGASGVSR